MKKNKYYISIKRIKNIKYDFKKTQGKPGGSYQPNLNSLTGCFNCKIVIFHKNVLPIFNPIHILWIYPIVK